MKAQTLRIDRLLTERLLLIPFTMPLCEHLMQHDFSDLLTMGLKKGQSWPDQDVMETLPKIHHNLSRVGLPTGFESWMIIKNDTQEIIGDLGFKGFNDEAGNIDLGYGIIKEERRNGYAEEAARALIEWALATGIVAEITARCSPDNIGSIHLLRKLNFREIKVDHEMVYWSLANK